MNLIARSRPDNVRVSYITQFVQAARQASGNTASEQEGEDDEEPRKEVQETDESREAKRKVIRDLMSSIKQLRIEGTDKEFEGFVNLLISLILQLFPAEHSDFNQLIVMLTDAVSFSSGRTANPSLSARYAAVAIIFNSLPSSLNTLRLNVLLKLVSFAASNDDFTIIQPALNRLESYLIEWGFGPGSQGEEEGNAAIGTVVEALTGKGKLNEARTVLFAHLSAPSAVAGSSTTPSASASKLASQLIALSLALPQMYDFASLASIPAVASPSTPALASLLSIFQSGDVASFEEFAKQNQSVLSEHNLDSAFLGNKLRLLALAELCSHKVGENVTYDEIASSLRLQQNAQDDGEEVESWVIDGECRVLSHHKSRSATDCERMTFFHSAIRASLVSGRLSQSSLSFHVTRAAPRTFTQEHWAQLATRLQGWRSSLDGILESVNKGLPVASAAHSAGAAELAQQDGDDVEQGQEQQQQAETPHQQQEVTVA